MTLRIWLRAALWAVAIALAAWLAGRFLGEAWAWGVLVAGLSGLLAFHVHSLAALARWAQRPQAGEVPEGRGLWGDVLRALHRHEREAARRQVAATEALARFRRAVQALPDGVVILDARGCIEWCNDTAAAQLGLDPAADLGQPVTNLVRIPAFVEYLRDGGAVAPSITIEARPGTRLMVQALDIGEDQRLLLARDVTQAERVEAMRRDFVANVSHELRTPLTVLAGFLETVRTLKLDPQRVQDYLGMMQEQSARMQRIIEDLLTLSQLESAPAPAAQPIAVAPLLERVYRDAEALSGGRHRIVLSAEPTLDLLGAEAELASAFGNLVSNAVRYTPAGGEIRIEWREEPDGSARFSVADTGVGIAPEHLPRLTERFYRVDRSRSRETGGTGLGLAIVKHALSRHDARLDIESAPGKGSRFSARFPPARLGAAVAREQP